MEIPKTKERKTFAVSADRVKLIQDHDFYSVHRNKEGEFKEIVIKKVKFVEKLKSLGFRRFDLKGVEKKYVRIEKNTIEEVTENFIVDAFFQFVENLQPYEHSNGETSITINSEIIKDKLFNALEMYFKPALFNRMLNDKPIVLKQDNANEKFFFYQNCWVTVSRFGYEVNDYADLDGYVWKDMILPRTFTAPEENNLPCYFDRFFANITNHDKDRITSLKTILGYNMHSFYKGKLKATIFTDAKISEDGEPNGRTGKGILCKAMGNMLNANMKESTVYVSINGREYDPKNINKHQACNLDTRLLHIEDIFNNYNIENSFNDITEGLMVRKLFTPAFRIQSKIIFTTNKTILIQGESSKDRVIQFELSEHYSSNYDPSMEFKHWFFDDWDIKEFNRFDLFMFDCCAVYFATGLKEAEAINLRIKTLQDHTSIEFVRFMDDLLKKRETITYSLETFGNSQQHEFKIDNEEQIIKTMFFEIFKTLNKDFNNARFKQNTFTKWVRMYCRNLSIQFKEDRTNGKDYFVFWGLNTM